MVEVMSLINITLWTVFSITNERFFGRTKNYFNENRGHLYPFYEPLTLRNSPFGHLKPLYLFTMHFIPLFTLCINHEFRERLEFGRGVFPQSLPIHNNN